jgi:hypothetical protein
LLVAATTPLDEEKESNFLRGEQDLFEGIEEKELHAKLNCISSVPSRGIPPLTTSKIRSHE